MSLGIVTEHLISLIAKQVNDNGVVDWCGYLFAFSLPIAGYALLEVFLCIK